MDNTTNKLKINRFCQKFLPIDESRGFLFDIFGDFNNPKSMTNLCSYLAIKVGEKIIDMGYKEYATLHLSISDEKLDNSTHLKRHKESNHHHNVVLFEGHIIDLTRKQFGNLIYEDITPIKEYLNLGWQLKHTTIFKKQKVKKLQRKYNN